jgi:hypothetical protein
VGYGEWDSHQVDHVNHGGIPRNKHQECNLHHIVTGEIAGFKLRKMTAQVSECAGTMREVQGNH